MSLIGAVSSQCMFQCKMWLFANDCAWEFIFSEVYFSLHRLMSVAHASTFKEKKEFLLKISDSVHFIIYMLINTEAWEIISVCQEGM